MLSGYLGENYIGETPIYQTDATVTGVGAGVVASAGAGTVFAEGDSPTQYSIYFGEVSRAGEIIGRGAQAFTYAGEGRVSVSVTITGTGAKAIARAGAGSVSVWNVMAGMGASARITTQSGYARGIKNLTEDQMRVFLETI